MPRLPGLSVDGVSCYGKAPPSLARPDARGGPGQENDSLEERTLELRDLFVAALIQLGRNFGVDGRTYCAADAIAARESPRPPREDHQKPRRLSAVSPRSALRSRGARLAKRCVARRMASR